MKPNTTRFAYMEVKGLKYPNIDAERARKNMSVDGLTNQLGVCKKTYYNWLKKGKIPQTMLEKMANLFHCSIDYLLGIEDQQIA